MSHRYFIILYQFLSFLFFYLVVRLIAFTIGLYFMVFIVNVIDFYNSITIIELVRRRVVPNSYIKLTSASPYFGYIYLLIKKQKCDIFIPMHNINIMFVIYIY